MESLMLIKAVFIWSKIQKKSINFFKKKRKIKFTDPKLLNSSVYCNKKNYIYNLLFIKESWKSIKGPKTLSSTTVSYIDYKSAY